MEEILHQLIGMISHYYYRVLYIPGGAGFLPSTVSSIILSCVCRPTNVTGLSLHLNPLITHTIVSSNYNIHISNLRLASLTSLVHTFGFFWIKTSGTLGPASVDSQSRKPPTSNFPLKNWMETLHQGKPRDKSYLSIFSCNLQGDYGEPPRNQWLKTPTKILLCCVGQNTDTCQLCSTNRTATCNSLGFLKRGGFFERFSFCGWAKKLYSPGN